MHSEPSHADEYCVPLAHHLTLPDLPSPLLFLDLEIELERVVEVCAIRIDGVSIPQMLWSRVNPGYPMTASRQRNRRHLGLPPIDPDVLAMAPTMRELVPGLLHAAQGTTVVAHNASYDRRYLRGELARWSVDWSPPHLCSLKLAKLLLPEHDGSYSLGCLASEFGLRNPAPHSAGGDAVTLVGVVTSMLVRHARNPQFADVLRACTTPGTSGWTR